MKPLPPFRYLWPFWVALATNVFAALCMLILMDDLMSSLGSWGDTLRLVTRYIAGYIFFPAGALLSSYQLYQNRFRFDMYWPLIVWMWLMAFIWAAYFPPGGFLARYFLIWFMGLFVLYSIRFFVKIGKNKAPFSLIKWILMSCVLLLGILLVMEIELNLIYIGFSDSLPYPFIYYLFFVQAVFILMNYLHARDRMTLAERSGEAELALIDQIGQNQ